jgi:hypothetical protein
MQGFAEECRAILLLNGHRSSLADPRSELVRSVQGNQTGRPQRHREALRTPYACPVLQTLAKLVPISVSTIGPRPKGRRNL